MVRMILSICYNKHSGVPRVYASSTLRKRNDTQALAVLQVKPVLNEFKKEVYSDLTVEKNESKKVFNSIHFPVDI